MTEKRKLRVEVCFSPALYSFFDKPDAVVVIVDILRASTAICTAFINGAAKLIPVATLEQAKAMKEKGYLVAAERDGIVRDFADFGNSPFNFTPERVKDKVIVYSTTNGTQAVHLASSGYQVLIGSFLNISSITDHTASLNRDVLILCAGWKNKFCLEDSFYAGALTEKLISTGKFCTTCDSANAAIDLWNAGRDDQVAYIEKAAQRHRLKKSRLDDVLEYCFTHDTTGIIPVLEQDYLIPLKM